MSDEKSEFDGLVTICVCGALWIAALFLGIIVVRHGGDLYRVLTEPTPGREIAVTVGRTALYTVTGVACSVSALRLAKPCVPEKKD